MTVDRMYIMWGIFGKFPGRNMNQTFPDPLHRGDSDVKNCRSCVSWFSVFVCI